MKRFPAGAVLVSILVASGSVLAQRSESQARTFTAQPEIRRFTRELHGRPFTVNIPSVMLANPFQAPLFLAQDYSSPRFKLVPDGVLSYDPAKVTRTVRLTSDGGYIRIVSKDPTDIDTQRWIRGNLWQLISHFRNRKFRDADELSTAKIPGAADMQGLGAAIDYTLAQLPDGAALTFSARIPEGIIPVHQFLRYQERAFAGEADTAKVSPHLEYPTRLR
ncbi:MAG TPA: hypothetical protein VFM10_05640 [Terriglobales bacterium]|nr:hypothetical protein [Terriglobales bacterium]